MGSIIRIGNKEVGNGKPCFIIAEVAQAHDGSLGMAHAYIDAAAKHGADAIKFQTHIAAAESSLEEPWRVKFSYQDVTRFDYWKRMEFTAEQWAGLKKHADEAGIIFLSSPFSDEAVDLLAALEMAAWKVASGETGNPLLLKKMESTGKPLLISTGMSTYAEIDALTKGLDERMTEYALFQCTTAYPCPPEKIGLNVIAELRGRYGCPCGLSDHSGEIWPGLAAVTDGCDLLEVHVTFSKEMFGPDVKASLTFDQLESMAAGIRFTEKMKASPIDKTALPAELAELKEIFGKSAAARRDLQKGEILQVSDVILKKPCAGIPASEINRYIGKRLLQDVAQGAFIKTNVFDDKA